MIKFINKKKDSYFLYTLIPLFLLKKKGMGNGGQRFIKRSKRKYVNTVFISYKRVGHFFLK